MALKIEPATVEELEAEFGTSSSGNDPETVSYIRTLDIGNGFNVSAEGGETDRMVKRRINACAKEAFRELDWRTRPSGGLAARVKTIDTAAETEWLAAQVTEETEEDSPETVESSEGTESTNGSQNGETPLETPLEGSSEPETGGRKKREPASV